MSTTKIQINSLEALERLIGNDTELEIEVRNSVIQNFTKKHLKDLATLELVSNISKAVQQEIKSQFFEDIKVGTWHTVTTVFKKEILDKIKEDLKSTARQELNSVVLELIEETKVRETVISKLNQAVDNIDNILTSKDLERRLNDMVNKRLKERLNIS